MAEYSRSRRPGRGTMAGMIYDANDSLNWIMDNKNITEVFRSSRVVGSHVLNGKSFNSGGSNSKSKLSLESDQFTIKDFKENKSIASANNYSSGSLAALFSDDEERDLLGIAFFTIWEAGIVLSGYRGTGIVLSRNIMNGEWSGPVAVNLGGVGAGLLLGASVRTIVYLIYDYFTLKSIIGTDGGIIFGVGAGATIGTWTKETGKQAAYITSPKMLRTAGIGSNVALCRGLAGIYGAVSIEAGICKTRDRINARFYGKENLTGSDILLSGDTIEIDNSNVEAKRLLEKVHMKLKTLCLRDDPQLYQGDQNFGSSKHSGEDARATLEELYVDEEFDYQVKMKDSGSNKNETGKEHIVALKGEEINGDQKETLKSAVSPIKRGNNEDDSSEEMTATETAIFENE